MNNPEAVNEPTPANNIGRGLSTPIFYADDGTELSQPLNNNEGGTVLVVDGVPDNKKLLQDLNDLRQTAVSAAELKELRAKVKELFPPPKHGSTAHIAALAAAAAIASQGMGGFGGYKVNSNPVLSGKNPNLPPPVQSLDTMELFNLGDDFSRNDEQIREIQRRVKAREGRIVRGETYEMHQSYNRNVDAKNAFKKRLKAQQAQQAEPVSKIELVTTPDPVAYRLAMNDPKDFMFKTAVDLIPEDIAIATVWGLYDRRQKGYSRDPVAFWDGDRSFRRQPALGFSPLYLGPRVTE